MRKKTPCKCARCRCVATANREWGYDEALVSSTECLVCGDPIGKGKYALETSLARFGQMFVLHAHCEAKAGASA
jgi:hypothetical protein